MSKYFCHSCPLSKYEVNSGGNLGSSCHSRAVGNPVFKYLFIFLLFYPSLIFAWSAPGHRIVGHIAYDKLTPAAKEQIDTLLNVPIEDYPLYSRQFVGASAWADQIRKSDIPDAKKYKSWHFVDDIISALNNTRQTMQNPSATPAEKAFALRFFIHLIADIHQPLHCTNGDDKGGNLFAIKSPYADNLHSLWDRGVGLFKFKKRWAKTYAVQIEKRYPFEQYKTLIEEHDSTRWAAECHQFSAIAYNTEKNVKLSTDYIKQGQKITEQQLAIAGYRLAYQLNGLFK